jgi:perosamine synthetase
MKNIDRKKIEDMCISLGHSIKEAMAVISRGGIATAFIVDEKTRKFQGLITDGDIRRAILKGATLETKIDLVQRPKPTTATTAMAPHEIAKLFGELVRVIPVLDEEDKIADIALYDPRFRLPVAEPSLGENELAYVTDCIVTNWISSTGKYVTQFEEMFAKFCGTKYAIATSNGTTALHLALLAFDIKAGDEVLVPSLTFIATANAVTYTGAKPVFIDSETKTWNMDPALLEKAITPKTKAIIPVHLYGHPAEMDAIMAIARKHKLAVIEDAAEAHGAEHKNRRVGGIGDIGVFSFYGNKIITTGEGGMITTNDAKLVEKIRLLRDHGMTATKRYWHPVVGYNYRLTNIQAAIGVAQVERIDTIIAAKLDVAKRYEQQLKGIPGIVCPPKEAWAKNVYWLYSILVEEEYGMTRDALMQELNGMHIDTRPFFPPVHTQPIYQTSLSLKVAEELANKGLSLPSSASLQSHEVDRVCSAIREIHQKIKNDKLAAKKI